MSGHEGLPAEGPSRKDKERHRVLETGSMNQKQSLKLFFPFLREYLYFLLFLNSLVSCLCSFLLFFFHLYPKCEHSLESPLSCLLISHPLYELNSPLSASSLCPLAQSNVHRCSRLNIQGCSHHQSPSLLESILWGMVMAP